MGGSGERYDSPAKGDWSIKSRISFPRTTRTTRTLTQGRSLGRVFAAPPPDPRLRRALGLGPKGGLGKGPLIQASMDRIPLPGLDLAAEAVDGASFPSGEGPLAAGTATHSLSRTPVSEQDSMEQACLQNGGRRSSPGTQWRTGRREASRTAMPWTQNRGRRLAQTPYRRQPFVVFVLFVVETSFGFLLRWVRCVAKSLR